MNGRTGARWRATAGLAAAAVTALLLVGCGSGGGPDGVSAGNRPSAPVRPAGSAPAAGSDGSAATSGSGAAPTTGGPTVPKSELTPATGTFTDPQKDYLVGKVPFGMDPAAVLQTGQESCERIADTDDANPAAARRAVGNGEIAYARDAITYLCPRFRNLLTPTAP